MFRRVAAAIVNHMHERTFARVVLSSALLVLLVLVGFSPTAAARGKPDRSPTTTVTEPRIPTTLTVNPPASYTIPGCTPPFACPFFRSSSVLSGRLTTAEGEPIASRTIAFRGGDYSGISCEAVTDATGLGRCLSSHGSVIVVDVTGSFAGDSTYAPSEGAFRADVP